MTQILGMGMGTESIGVSSITVSWPIGISNQAAEKGNQHNASRCPSPGGRVLSRNGFETQMIFRC